MNCIRCMRNATFEPGLREVKIVIIKKLISMSIISTSLTVPGETLSRFHVEAWLPFRNCEMDF